MIRTRVIASLAALLLSAHARADGSVTFDQADEFLKQAPELRAFLMATLCISENGLAPRLAGEYPLGGLRIGPYEFAARAKNDPAGPWLTLSVVTRQALLGKDGKPLPREDGKAEPWDRAYRIRETFRSVELSPRQHGPGGLKAVNCEGLL
jgi:hypothetical protein